MNRCKVQTKKWKFKEINKLNFILNGTKITVDTTTITLKTTLNDYIRKTIQLTGTKYMCKAGGCGSCIVSATYTNPITNTKETKAVNSCLVTVLQIQDWEITTIEGLGNRSKGYDEIQQKIVDYNATQCGFCTPGVVMSMYALKQSGETTKTEIENSFGSNLCRCTGYRPILSAFKSLSSNEEDSLSIPDIEELTLCYETGKTCKETCKITNHPCKDSSTLIFTTNLEIGKGFVTQTDNWYKVATTDDIFNVFAKNPGRSYQLVAGNTAQGVYKDIINRDYFIDISSVPELQQYSHNTTVLILGGNLTLNDTLKLCQQVSASDDGFKHLGKVAEHMDLVAHVPVRNIGTLAGNLSIKHTHNEFPSDIFILLETIGAQVVIDDGNQKRKMSPLNYLQYNMEHKIIHSIEIPPLDSSYRFESYKIMKRAQNAHAIINAGFLINLNLNNEVETCTIVYGGVNSNFIHATKTEEVLVGKILFNNTNMQLIFTELQNEITPDDTPPEPGPQFRKELCIGLFYKYILSIVPDNLVSQKNKSGGPKLIRPALSSGVQEYTTDTTIYPIGQPTHKLEAVDQASGEAKYVTDLPDKHNQCFAVFVQGDGKPGQILLSITADQALALDGVEGFYQASDIPGVNSFMIPIPTYDDELIFLPIGLPIKFHNQPVGMIVANSQDIAEKASKLVVVTFAPLITEPVITTKDAILHPERLEAFNVWVPTTEPDLLAPVKFTGVFESLPQYHAYMELCVASVTPEDNGDFLVEIGTHWMDHVQSTITRSLLIPAHKIKVQVKRVGGSYGGKINRTSWLSCAATLAAAKLNKPVKFYLNMETNMNVMGKRIAVRSIYDIGVDLNGVIGYLNNNIYSNIGVYRNSNIENHLFQRYAGPYNTDTFWTNIDLVRTDIAAATYMRAPGYMEGSAIIEYIMDHIAIKLNKDPVDVRLVNFKNDTLLHKMTQEALTWSNYRERRQDIDDFNQNNHWRKKGISLIPIVYTLTGFFGYFAQVSVFAIDGTVAIIHGGIELGQGINTNVAMVAAYLLGIDMSMIKIWPSNNFIAPNNFGTGGTVTSESICLALQTACANLLKRINDAAATKLLPPETPWLAKVLNAYTMGVSMTENACYSHDQTDPTFFLVYGVGVSEVELDVLTGKVIVQRADLLEDTGNSLNPYIDIGQVEGAYVKGLGHWTCEEIIYDSDGVLLTNNTWNYKVPGARDIPVHMNVKFPTGQPNPLSPFKNKSTSEPPLCLAFSVPLAIKHALQTVRTQFDPSNDPWTVMEGSCTNEWIYTNSLHNAKNYKL